MKTAYHVPEGDLGALNVSDEDAITALGQIAVITDGWPTEDKRDVLEILGLIEPKEQPSWQK